MLCFIGSGLTVVAAAPTPTEVLARATAYHDPHGEWAALEDTTFHFIETRPGAENKTVTMVLNNRTTSMRLDRNGTEAYAITRESCTVIAGERDAARGLMLRNYYLYLWGLPMKLHDADTPLDAEVTTAEIDGAACDVIRVVYEQDTWYFFIDQQTGRMRRYTFYKDEAAGKGELIKLEDEIQVGSMRIPQKRSWYTLPGMKYLGTDILTKTE